MLNVSVSTAVSGNHVVIITVAHNRVSAGTLSLSGNSFSGEFPVEIGQWTQLGRYIIMARKYSFRCGFSQIIIFCFQNISTLQIIASEE